MIDDAWSELRGFERIAPSPLAFRALGGLLETWAGPDQSEAVAEASRILETWPDATRLAPWSWCKAASLGARLAAWPLVRALQLVPEHLTKSPVNLARLAHYVDLSAITELRLPRSSGHHELALLALHPYRFPALKRLHAVDSGVQQRVQMLADSSLWDTLEAIELDLLDDSLFHRDVSRLVPHRAANQLRHVRMRASDLMALWDRTALPRLTSAELFVRSIDEARQLAARPELARLTSLGLAFRCASSGRSPFEPFLGNILVADETAADVFFEQATLERLDTLSLSGYPMGYWGREGLGRLGLESLRRSGLLHQVTRFELRLLPLGDRGVAELAAVLGAQLKSLVLHDLYCESDGIVALCDSPGLANLVRLDLSANRMNAESAARLARIPMPCLTALNLGGPAINPYYWGVGQQPVGDEGAIAWAESSAARQLKSLTLSNTFLSDAGFEALLGSTSLSRLETLDLSHAGFTASALRRQQHSSLWQHLQELRLNDCRLGDEEIEALTTVTSAPALRLLDLAYNAIGPDGAQSLAKWPVLDRIWQLGLHDNALGDRGLVALAQSEYTRRLVELDLEQDCWNGRACSYRDQTASQIADSRSLQRMDGLFTGCVDEYHTTAYAPGFSRQALRTLRHSPGLSAPLRASCRDFTGISDYLSYPVFDELGTPDENDFRINPPMLNEREADATEHRLHQVHADRAVSDWDPDQVVNCPALEELAYPEPDIAEGIEYLEPSVVTITEDTLSLPLDDQERPLPKQAVKWLTDALNSRFRAEALGRFDHISTGSRQDEQGRLIETHAGFSVGFADELETGRDRIREALWWIGAPAVTAFDEGALSLQTPPGRPTATSLQLGALTIVRWSFQGEPGHRFDRCEWTPAQRNLVYELLAETTRDEAANDWTRVTVADGGVMALDLRQLADSPNFDTLQIRVDTLTPAISRLLHQAMSRGGLMLLPMGFAVEPPDWCDGCEWPRVKLIESSETLYEILRNGPYDWWRRRVPD